MEGTVNGNDLLLGIIYFEVKSIIPSPERNY